MPWSIYPDGIELVQVPELSHNYAGATVRLVVRCEPEVGKKMCFIPLEQSVASGTG